MYQKKLFFVLWLSIYLPMSVFSYTLSTEKALYIPIAIDDLTTIIALRPSELISPENNANINGTLYMKFSKGAGVEKKRLTVYYANHTKLAMQIWLSSDTYTVGLPKDGKYIDVELRSYIADKYFIKKYRFRQSVDPSEIVSPKNNTHLEGNTLTLEWDSGLNVTKRYIYAGTSGYGSTDIFEGYVSGNSKKFYDLPKNGETIYVIFLSMIDGQWYHTYYTYYATDVESKAKNFVLAYLTNNTNAMRKITTQAQIDKLKTKDSTVKRYFRKIRSYHKLLYFHEYQAMVIGKMSDGKEITFYFSWDGTRWVLDSVV